MKTLGDLRAATANFTDDMPIALRHPDSGNPHPVRQIEIALRTSASAHEYAFRAGREIDGPILIVSDEP